MSTEPSHPEGDELAPGEVLRLYGMSPHSAKNLIAKIKADALREFVSAAQDLLNCSGDTRWMARALARADLIEAGVKAPGGDDG